MNFSTLLQLVQLLSRPKAIWQNFRQSPVTSAVGYGSFVAAALAYFQVGVVGESLVTVLLLAAVGLLGVFTKDTDLSRRIREQTDEFIGHRYPSAKYGGKK
jgi:hypothetical protein